jgi:activator of HSP90 ATPase
MSVSIPAQKMILNIFCLRASCSPSVPGKGQVMALDGKRPARRQLLLVGLAGGAMLAAGKALAAPKASASIHQEENFSVPPARVYAALMDEKEFSAFSGAPAKIGKGEGDAFSLFGGAITGRNLELAPGRRVVQAWRSSDWPPSLYSVIRFELVPAGQGTHLAFDQVGYPLSDYANLVPGWHSHYWEPMKKYFVK